MRRTPLAAAAALALAMPLSLLAGAPPALAGVVKTNAASITIPDVGAAAPYPSSIAVSGVPRLITDVDVTLHGISHTFVDDLDILLVGPGGQTVLLLSDAGGGSDFVSSTVTFDDEPSRMAPDGSLPTGLRFQPTNYDTTTDSLPAPAPAPPAGGYGTSLSVFDGTTATGNWSLYVRDDSPIDSGQIVGGWSLEFTAGQANDLFTRSTPIHAVTATVTGDTVGANDEPGESSSTDSVWYRWVAPGDGLVTLDMCGSPASMLAQVYTGPAVSSLTAVPVSITACPAPGPLVTSFAAVTGTTYSIRVAAATAGAYVLQLTGPANTSPTIKPVAPLRALKDRTPKVAAKVTDTAGLTAGSIRAWVDGRRQRSFAYNPATGALSFTSRKLAPGRHTVKITAVDFHRGTTTRSWKFRITR